MLDAIFLALAHPVRRSILERLRDGDATVTELVEMFELTQPSISNHLRVLGGAGLVTRHRDAQFRRVRLATGPLSNASAWIATMAR